MYDPDLDPPVTAAQDQVERFRPAHWQLLGAQALLWYAHPHLGADRVVVALALPGKTRGVWVLGQEVETVNGFWYAQHDSPEGGGFAALRARASAEAAAVAALYGRAGVPVHVVIERSGRYEVFEGHELTGPA